MTSIRQRETAMEKNWLDGTWKTLVVRGVLALVFGVVAIAWPTSTAIALAVVWGFWALADGIGNLVQAVRPGPASARLAFAAMGVIALVAAFFAIFSPSVTAVALTWILGIWLILRGVMELALSFSDSRPAPRGMMLLGAALDFVLGVLFVTNPGASVVGIAVLIGIMALAWGAVFVTIGLMLRKHAGDTVSSGPVVPHGPTPA
jgi:uncharacterized membrane protein HdeD (DUF308 family)